MITFETQKDFEDAVMAVLHQRLNVSVYVDMVYNGDYYNPIKVPEIKVELKDGEYTICNGGGKAY